MKRIAIPVLVALITLLALVANPELLAHDGSPDRETKTGFLIPSQCQPQEGAARPKGPYDEWPAPHTTECSLREACIASGYGLWVMDEKTFYRFDEAGHTLALDYFRTTRRTSYNKVEIVGDFGDVESVEIFEMQPTD